MRDDFNQETKEILARRVGYRCSNPNCRASTSGPQDDPTKAVNVGVAAHITAASEGGPRYDKRLSSDERKSPENGIWLCQNCAKLIDSDLTRYTTDLLTDWKKASEHAALLDVGIPKPASLLVDESKDIELIRFYSQCLDRPAFQDRFRDEGNMEALDRAIEDTIIAINTGCLRARDGQVVAQSKGKSFLANHKWRAKMDLLVDLLRALRSRYAYAVESGEIHLGLVRDNRQYYHIRNSDLEHWMDNTREEILSIFSEICDEAGIPQLHFPRTYRHW